MGRAAPEGRPDVTEQEVQHRRRPDLARLVTLTAPLLGFGAFALLKWVDWGGARDTAARGGENELGVWELLIAAGVFFWTILAGAGLKALGELNAWLPETTSASRKRWRTETVWFVCFVYGAIALLLVLGALAELTNSRVLPGQELKNGLLHVAAGVALLPFLVALKRIQLCAADETGWSTTAKDVERIRYLRRCLRTATASLGAVIALAVISTGALRQAVEAAGLDALPDTYVLVYGAWLTGVLAAIYLHVFAALEARARWIVERVAPLPDPKVSAADAFAASTGLRSELSRELELGGDPRKNLEGLVAVLSPLGGALLSRLGGL